MKKEKILKASKEAQTANDKGVVSSSLLYRICFKSKATGCIGIGKPITKELADAGLKELESRYSSTLEHWLEKV